MRLPTVAGSPASCAHQATGDLRVTIEGKPVSLINVSTAGGAPIIGPGSPRVLVGGIAISTVGDAITPHGKSPHKRAVTTTLATKVFVP
jgi:uncharacterized Zn-binding protein involved in type VI secretion